MKRILIVDDEPSIVTLIEHHVTVAGFEADIAYDGKSAYNFAVEENYDLIILDIMLPNMSGFDVCEKLRSDGVETPILILTAKHSEEDKLRGLYDGADDYLTKPFSPKELIARIHAILRRTNKQTQTNNETALTNGDIIIYPDKYEVLLEQNKINLTTKEFELLLYLTINKGKPISREQLLNEIWEYDFIGESRIVDVHISKLREKIEADIKNPHYIKSIYGVGYKMEDIKP